MSKVILLLCIAFLAVSIVVAQEAPTCKPGGRICSSDTECCTGLICNPWAGRCTMPKTTTAAPTTPSSVITTSDATGANGATGASST